MVGGPARDLALSRPFWKGKEWAMLRSRDRAPPHLLRIIIIIHLSFFSPHLLASCSRLSPPTFSRRLFSPWGCAKGRASKAGLGPSSLRPWSVCVHATSADFHVGVVSGCPYIVPRLIGCTAARTKQSCSLCSQSRSYTQFVYGQCVCTYMTRPHALRL